MTQRLRAGSQLDPKATRLEWPTVAKVKLKTLARPELVRIGPARPTQLISSVFEPE